MARLYSERGVRLNEKKSDELDEENGKLEVYPYGEFKVPSEILNAVEKYPDAFRAGSLGTDVYLDIIVE